MQPDGRLGPEPSREISFLPYVHNVDSFGYNSDVIAVGEPYVEESWGWLLDPKHSGRVALVNAPSIGIFDLALAARARGLIDFADIGAMTADEVDALFEIAIDYKLNNHFRAFWRSVPDSADLMLSGDVHIASMFSPGVTMVRSAGLPCLYAAPREGYRAWHGVMCMSRACSGEQQYAAYAFMNWWLSGWAGAFIARQGYYISNPERSRPFMESDEWGYWYEGLPAERPMPGPDGRIAVEPGEVRRGGSYVERFENIAVWNTVMPTYDRTVRRWSELSLSSRKTGRVSWAVRMFPLRQRITLTVYLTVLLALMVVIGAWMTTQLTRARVASLNDLIDASAEVRRYRTRVDQMQFSSFRFIASNHESAVDRVSVSYGDTRASLQRCI